MPRVNLKFKKTGTFIYEGVCSVDVDDPADMDDVAKKVKELSFTRFQIRSKEYPTEEWSYEFIGVENAT